MLSCVFLIFLEGIMINEVVQQMKCFLLVFTHKFFFVCSIIRFSCLILQSFYAIIIQSGDKLVNLKGLNTGNYWGIY